ncbi:hypothetical protein PAHAL_1G286300 [Panicum hallii]|uniref:Glycine-rich protein n=1 Tax=Panicum hallii TaxID=206008 RepID=A0A2S3GQY2_9POAL|nr:glycine-rich cell wall structural protein-like [Panicum hallii]PAN06756.1 hypothetical protein PAHAL_1G286300 [Panicum hallii]
MASKALLVLALLLAAAFLVASANNEHTQLKEEENKQAGVQDYRGGGGYPYGRYPGGGWRGGGYPGGGYPGRGGGYPGRGRGGYCQWGCCNRGYYGGCRCCSRPDEIPEPMYRPEFVEVHN